MAIPKFQDFLYHFLLQLKDRDVSSREMKEILIGHFSLTEEDCLQKTKGGSAFQIDDRNSHGDRYWGMTAAMTQAPVPSATSGKDSSEKKVGRPDVGKIAIVMEAPEYGCQFPKDENRETEVSGFRFFVSGWGRKTKKLT